MSGSLEISSAGTPVTLEPHNFVNRPSIEVRSEAKLYLLSRAFQRYVARPLQLSKSSRSRLFVVGSQIGSLTFGPSFGHNLCFKCPNEQCEPILDIYVPRAFHWYKERHKPLGFDPYNCSLKFWESTGTPSPKVGVSLGVWVFTPSHSLTLFYIPGSMWCDSSASSWPAPL
jgi:hypothetical protein